MKLGIKPSGRAAGERRARREFYATGLSTSKVLQTSPDLSCPESATPIQYTKEELFSKHHEVRKDYEMWRLTDRIAGQINGLSGSFGILVATNGVLCLIEQTDKIELFEGHLQFFISQDKEEQENVVRELKPSLQPREDSRVATSVKELMDLV